MSRISSKTKTKDGEPKRTPRRVDWTGNPEDFTIVMAIVDGLSGNYMSTLPVDFSIHQVHYRMNKFLHEHRISVRDYRNGRGPYFARIQRVLAREIGPIVRADIEPKVVPIKRRGRRGK